MRALAASLFSLILAHAAWAQTPEGWVCEDGMCSKIEPLPVASLTGVFAHATDVSAERDVERMAALEQQRWREFQFDVVEDARIKLTHSVAQDFRPEDWPSGRSSDQIAGVSVFISEDGENYTPFDLSETAKAGRFLSVIIGQKTEGLDGDSATFFPAKWQIDLAAYHVVPQQQVAGFAPIGPALIEIGGSNPVYCIEANCPPLAHDEAPEIPNAGSDTPPEPDQPTLSAAADELAAELQTELARLGCYTSAVDGLWGPGSRRAMSAFNAATGNDLPVAAPSPKALVAAARQAEPVCGEN